MFYSHRNDERFSVCTRAINLLSLCSLYLAALHYSRRSLELVRQSGGNVAAKLLVAGFGNLVPKSAWGRTVGCCKAACAVVGRASAL